MPSEQLRDGNDRDSGEDEYVKEPIPPFEAYFVAEVDVAFDRENPLFCRLRGPYPTREKAERERDEQQNAWQDAIEEWDEGNPYDFKGWQIIEHHVWDHQIDKLQREDEESHQATMEAAGVVGASLLADEGIGPLAGGDDE